MTAVGAFWVDGRYYFCGGSQSRKIRNIERDPRFAFGVAIHGYDVAHVYVPIGDGPPRQDCLIHDPTEDTERRDRMTLVRMPSLRTDRSPLLSFPRVGGH